MKKTSIWIYLLIFLFSCQKENQEPPLFELLPAEKTGVDFQNTLNSSEDFNIIEYLYFYNGGGVSTADFNNDGLVDIFFTGNQVSNELYLNQGDFKFKKITESAGLASAGQWSTGVTTADVNGDGLLDIYVCQVSGYKGLEGKNRLYINQGDNTFLDLAEYYGVDFQGLSTHAAFFDYDKDGDLDLYLLNHSVKSPEVFAEANNRSIPEEKGDRLYRNKAAQGERGFEDVTDSAGIYSSVLGFGLGVSIEDFNADGWLDIYVSNDFTENDYLYLNQQDGTFKESLQQLIANTSRYSMGNDAADLNNDGLPEIFTTDMLPENPEIWMKSVGEDKQEVYRIKKKFGYSDQYVRNNLQLNRGEEGFSEIAYLAGVEATDWSWSPLLVDLDNDGWKDIHVTNGIVKRPNDLDFIQYSQDAPGDLSLEELRKRQIEMLPTMQLPNYAFKNLGNLQFENITESWGLDQKSYSNGSAYADLDNDGDLDLVINNLDQEAFIYENKSERSGHSYLKISLQGMDQNLFGLGAEVTLFAAEKSWTQRLSTSRGFQSGGSTHLLFGLGKTQSIDSIRVEWSSGNPEMYYADSVNQFLTLAQGKGKVIHPSNDLTRTSSVTQPIAWSYVENEEYNEWNKEYLLPRSFANHGPALAVADVNADGWMDLYFGGAKNQAASLFLGSEEGFEEVKQPVFEQLAKAEDVVAEFADLNGDGFLDLYVGSGGNEFEPGNLFLFDRVYFGDGRGNFGFSPNSLPPRGENTSTIALHDLDGDGDADIFVGVSVVSGDYGRSGRSYLLINQGNGRFEDQTDLWFGKDFDFGMIHTAVWADMTSDGKPELIFSGDWQGIRVVEIQNNSLVEKAVPGLELSSGWIQQLLAEDLDGNGRLDLAVGNLGLNSKLKASEGKPAWLYHGDFDANGQNDPILFHYMEDKLVPFGSRDDLIKQIPEIKRKHPSYSDYAKITSPEDLFAAEKLSRVRKLPAYNFSSGVYFQKHDGTFTFEAFPVAAQLSPIQSMLWDKEDKRLYLGANLSGLRVDLGDAKANSFSILERKNEEWVVLPHPAGLPTQTEIREIGRLSDQELLAVPHRGQPFLIKIR
ncbi:VCBS repeat-containing protein [Algoriphagus namhaensis]